MPRPTSQDLAGFWDLLQLSIDDVTMKFDQLQQIKNNNWRPVDSPEKKVKKVFFKKMWSKQKLFSNKSQNYILIFLYLSKGTSSRTKEDNSTEECNDEGEIPGPPRSAPAGSPPTAHGSQAGGLFPAELILGASGQHRDLYSRGSD